MKQRELYVIVCRVPYETLSICKVDGRQLLTKEKAELSCARLNANTSMSEFTVHPITVLLP